MKGDASTAKDRNCQKKPPQGESTFHPRFAAFRHVAMKKRLNLDDFHLVTGDVHVRQEGRNRNSKTDSCASLSFRGTRTSANEHCDVTGIQLTAEDTRGLSQVVTGTQATLAFIQRRLRHQGKESHATRLESEAIAVHDVAGQFRTG